MPQKNVVMAFRKRLRSYGYTEVSIGYLGKKEDKYIVRAVEPLAGNRVIVKLYEEEMYKMFR